MSDLKKSIESLRKTVDIKFDLVNRNLNEVHATFQEINKKFNDVDAKLVFTNNALGDVKVSFDEFASEISDHIIDLDVRVTKIEKRLDNQD